MKLPVGLKKRIRKTIIVLLSLSLVVVLVITFMQYGGDIFLKKKYLEIIIDSDTDNKPENTLSILRLSMAENIKILAVNAAHRGFCNDSRDSSMWISQKKNEEILKALKLTNISALPGENKMLKGRNSLSEISPAAEFIIKSAENRKSKEKLNIISFGPLTNIAAAILKDSTIASEIRLYCLLMQYDVKGKIWNKNEFNARSDLDALDILLDNQDLEIYFLPSNISRTIELTKRETDNYLTRRTSIETYLKDYSEDLFQQDEEIIAPSLALVEIILNPDFVKKEQVLPPPENKKHFVYVYSKVNSEMIKADFWAATLKFFRKNKDDKEN
jgi:inosine-uridine nucleoside N-ribohydrolase